MSTHTLALFADCPVRSKAISKGVAWLRKHRPMVESWARDLKLELSDVQAAIDADLLGEPMASAVATDSLSHNISTEITVVIPCHNYARFLADCLDSVQASDLKPRVIVIDDASSDDPGPIAKRFGVEFHRVEFRDVHRVRGFGLSLIQTKYVCFLDADNKLKPSYLSHCVSRLEADRNAAFCFPVLQCFGDDEGIAHGTAAAPAVVKWTDIESRNYCDANSVHRTEVLWQSLAFRLTIPTDCGPADWRLARQILRAGPWHALRADVPLLYRRHGTQMSAAPPVRYFVDADLQNEPVTICVAFSGRWSAWQLLRQWILRQTWPSEKTRLMILNSTHEPLTAERLGLASWAGASLQIERIDVGRPQLADEERRDAPAVGRAVEAAVCGLYNRAVQMIFGEWILFVEDDVIPQRPDVIAKLMESVGPHVACISGLYKHRYEDSAVAFGAPQGKLPMRAMEGPEIEHVTGTGFGCLLARRSVLSQFGLSGDDPRCKFYDVNIGVRIARAGYQWILDRSVYCEHLV
jgi:glycosyltransferase involved in cell wall biosynthesis